MRIVFFIFIALTLVSCDKQDNNDTIKVDGAILDWQGSYASCGCGFFLTINGHEYKPKNEAVIGESFMRSGDIEVVVEYEIIDETIESWCFDGQEPKISDGIIIHSITEE